MDKAPLIIAHALLRSASGERPGIDLPIAAGNMQRLAPAPDVVIAVTEHFRSHGFGIVGTPGISIGISGSKALFERHFGVALSRRAGHAQVARATAAPHDPTRIPDDRLPPAIRQAISQIALEAPASFDEAPGTDP